MTQDNGGPAFPTLAGPLSTGPTGMTLRDYFAARALEGRCYDGWGAKDIAEMAYEVADAMLAARKGES